NSQTCECVESDEGCPSYAYNVDDLFGATFSFNYSIGKGKWEIKRPTTNIDPDDEGRLTDELFLGLEYAGTDDETEGSNNGESDIETDDDFENEDDSENEANE